MAWERTSSSRLVVGPATWKPMWKIELPTTRPTGSNPASVTSRNSLTLRSEVYRPSRFCSRRSRPDSGIPSRDPGSYSVTSLPIRTLGLTAVGGGPGAARTAVPAACMVITQPLALGLPRPETRYGIPEPAGMPAPAVRRLQRGGRPRASRGGPNARTRRRPRPLRRVGDLARRLPAPPPGRLKAAAELVELLVAGRGPQPPQPRRHRGRREHDRGRRQQADRLMPGLCSRQ